MNRVGFHCAHEQHAPSDALQLALAAARAGFTHAMCSDHFHPWSEAQGHAAFTWSWLGAALQATHLTFGTVCAPGQRYHPAIVAQAAATLAEMSPERFWLAVGSGEALNEAITGDPWPPKPERNARLLESVEVMRALWRGETVTHDGLVRVQEAKLYTRPATSPLLYAAAMSEETARWAGSWADGLITVAGDRDAMRRVLDAFREGGGEGKPAFLQACLAYGRTDAESEATAVVQWRQAALTTTELADLTTPSAFDHASARLSPRAVLKKVRACADMERQREWIYEDLEMGFARVYLHNVVRDHTRFFEDWASRSFDTVVPRPGVRA
jgi:coenzyme F420-dependent glucose-6-phosphate dehydrogenase